MTKSAPQIAPVENLAVEASLPEHVLPLCADRASLLRIGLVVACVVASFTCLWLWKQAALSDWLALAATVFGGYPIYGHAWQALCRRRMTMELSMTIALLAAVSIGEFFTAAVIVLFVLVAELLEDLTVARGRRALSSLLAYLPQSALLMRGGAFTDTPLSAVRPGDVVLVKPGTRVAVDGTVISGQSSIDESSITGEAFPADKAPGSVVYAGTINQSGALQVEVVSVGADTAFGKIVHAVEEAEASQAPIENLADKLSGYLVYLAVCCAVLTFLVSHDVRATISVIIVAGACGIAAGTPLAILGAIGQAARIGVIVKGGIFIERLAAVDAVGFDKTGTLTAGKLHLSGINPRAGISDRYLLALAAAAERYSEHPIAAAIVAAAGDAGLTVKESDSFINCPGKGLSAVVAGHRVLVGNAAYLQEQQVAVPALAACLTAETAGEVSEAIGQVMVAEDGQYLGWIAVADKLRTGAADAVQQLTDLGIDVALLTGDLEMVANSIAEQAGITTVAAGLLPEQKTAYIEKLQAAGKKVAMVGDGINDAPALIAAEVGVAIGSGTDVALESADVMLISNDLRRLVDVIKIARRCKGVIMTNFVGTIAVDALGIVLASMGLLNPMLAAFIHVTSELLFIFNSARLLPAMKIQTQSNQATGLPVL